MTATAASAEVSGGRVPRPRRAALTDRAPRAALAVFAVVVLGAVVFYVIKGRDQWFFQDEWDFLADRDGGSLDDLFRPHNEHWSTLPIIVYRILWRTVGLRSYVVYQSLTIGLHLTAALMLRAVMRRAAVGPWVATAAASAFVLFGSGYQNIVWAFQIGFTGSLVLGLAHLLLADHDGPSFERRDGAGLACGLGALMCAGVGVTMVVVVGTALLLRRRWWAAALHTVPLGVVYLSWWWLYGRDAYGSEKSSPSDVVEFARIGIGNGLGKLGQLPGLGAVLTVLLLVGLVLAAVQGGRRFWRQRALPLAMAFGAAVFFSLSGLGRAEAFGFEFARRSRYAHLAVAMLLPALAVAMESFVRRWRLLALPAVAMLLVGVHGNLGAVEVAENKGVDPALVIALAQVPAEATVPASFRPFAESPERVGFEHRIVGDAPRLTMGWLREGVATGRIPELRPVAPDIVADATILLALFVDDEPAAVGPCVPLERAVTRRLDAGEAIGFRGPVLVTIRTPGGVPSRILGIARPRPSRLVTRYGPLTVTMAPFPGPPVQRCD
ncbi:MAG: hypothetical protein WKF43_05605 [Acidimicrobiales bacterium]